MALKILPMDTYEFVDRWNARIPADWEMEATGQPDTPEKFISVTGLDLVFLPGVRCRGIPEPHLQRMLDQKVIRRIKEQE